MNKEYNYRALSLRLSADGGPLSLDLDSRSMDVTAATENKVTVFDWQRFENIDEVLLMSGAKLPGSRQVVLLDSHDRGSTSSVVGSCRNLRVEGGDLAGRVFFANDAGAESAWGKTRDGHITDFSIGYRVNAATWVPEGQSAMIEGRAFDGPVRVVTDWTVRELSVCPIGADAAAKARAEANHTMARVQDPAPQKKESDMDKRLRDFLESRGLAKEVNEEAAWEFFRTVSAEPQTPAASVDMDAVVRRAVAEERERSGEIDAMCQRFDLGDLAAGLKTKGASVEEARKAVLDGVAERGAAQTTPAFRVSVGLEDKDKFRSAAQDALCMRAGIAVAAPAAGADELRGYSLREVARHSLMLSGQSTGGNVMEMVGRAMTTTDFPALLANTANKSLAAGYETAPETWQDWCGVGSVGDFKTHDLVSVSETEDLNQINESQPYSYGKRADAKEQYQIVTYGKMFAISRQTIINDDLSALTDIPRAHGEAAARKIGDVAYAVLAANAAMRDGVALFHASHGNLGTSGVISETTIGEAIKLMKLQKDLLGQRRLNIRPEIYLAPVALEGVSEIFFASNQFSGDTKGSTRANIYGGTRFTRVYDARMDDISSTAWFMAGPKGKTVNVYFLNGQQAPYLESRQGWSVDGVEYKVRIDCGAKAVDWKALVKNAGV